MARGNQTDVIGNPYSLTSQRANVRYFSQKCHRRDATIQQRDATIQEHQEELRQIAKVTERRVRKVATMRAIIENQQEVIFEHQRTEKKLLLELAKMRRKLDGAKHGNDEVIMFSENTSVETIVMD